MKKTSFLLLLALTLAALQMACKTDGGKSPDMADSTGKAAAPGTSGAPAPNIELDSSYGLKGCDQARMTLLPKENVELIYQNHTVRLSHVDNNAGERIVIKHREKPDSFTVPMVGAMFFKGIRGRFMFVDMGTGPDGRELLIFDLLPGRQVHQLKYGGEEDPFVTSNSMVWYWTPVTDEAAMTKKPDCPEKAEWEKKGLRSGYLQRGLYNLMNKSITAKSEYRCVAMQ